jgi:hypothetical protein
VTEKDTVSREEPAITKGLKILLMMKLLNLWEE